MRRSILALLALLIFAAPAHAALDPVVEASNYSKTLERQALYDSPAGRALLTQISAPNLTAALQAQVNDPERAFAGDLCWAGADGCAGDARLYDWKGLVAPVLFTARNGATLSGHVWATRAGPAQRPGVVITNGSVQADEQMYWYAAQALAKAGYVVLTFDPQGQGQSDTLGEGADAGEGMPAQTDGRPFFDGTEDAINFFFSTPEHPYVPVPSCSSGTSHAAKQARRAAAGLDAAYNPFAGAVQRRSSGSPGTPTAPPASPTSARGPARGRDRRLGQPRRAERRARTAARSRPARPAAPIPRQRTPANFTQARARDVRRLLPAADAEHLGARPAGEVDASRSPTPPTASTPAS